jgi:hypothetical protein
MKTLFDRLNDEENKYFLSPENIYSVLDMKSDETNLHIALISIYFESTLVLE